MMKLDLQLFGGRGGNSGKKVNTGFAGAKAQFVANRQGTSQPAPKGGNTAQFAAGSTKMGEGSKGGVALQRAIRDAERSTTGSDGLNHSKTQDVLRENVRSGDSVVVQRQGGEIHYTRIGVDNWREANYQYERSGGQKVARLSTANIVSTRTVARDISVFTTGSDPEGDYNFYIRRKRK